MRSPSRSRMTMNYLEGALQGFIWSSYCATLAIVLRVGVYAHLPTRNAQTMLASIIHMLLLGGGLWLAVGCVAASLCAVAALDYSVIEAVIGFAAMGVAFGLSYKLLYDYVRVKK